MSSNKSGMKKRVWSAILLAGLLACSSVMPAWAEDNQAVQEDGQNPVMNFIGNYGAGRATITVSAEGNENAAFHITWGSSAAEHSEWDMSGPFDVDSLTAAYDNCCRRDVVFNEDGEVVQDTTVYEDGTGKIRFEEKDESLFLYWDDEKEHMADDMAFEFFTAPSGEDFGADATEAVATSSVSLEEGTMTIRIEMAGEDKEGFFWSFDRDSEGNGTVFDRITDSDQDGYPYVGSFRGLEDGTAVIRLIHGNGTFVDQYMTFDITVKGGKITENTGGSHVH